MKVVCIQTRTIGTNRYSGEKTDTPQEGCYKGEIYTVIEIDGEYYRLAELPQNNRYKQKYFRPVDDTFGELVEEIISKQLELETVEA